MRADMTCNDLSQAHSWIHCFVVSKISIFVAREKASYFLCCLNQISWVLPGNSLFALFSIEFDK